MVDCVYTEAAHISCVPHYRAAPDAKLNDIKALLGKMLFSGAGMEKKVGAAGAAEEGAVIVACCMNPNDCLQLAHPWQKGSLWNYCVAPLCFRRVFAYPLQSLSTASLQVEWLSGGEKARLALAKFMLTKVGHSGAC
jgi:hypothetical protein